MELTDSNTARLRFLPFIGIMPMIMVVCYTVETIFPFNLIPLLFASFVFFKLYVVNRIWLFYKLKRLYFNNFHFYTSETSQPFTIQDIESVSDIKKSKVTAVRLKDGTVYYFIFNSKESKELLLKTTRQWHCRGAKVKLNFIFFAKINPEILGR